MKATWMLLLLGLPGCSVCVQQMSVEAHWRSLGCSTEIKLHIGHMELKHAPRCCN